MHNGFKTVTTNKPFRFELCWFTRDDLAAVVNKIWHSNVNGKDNLAIWMQKMRNLRRCLKGWNLNVEGAYRKKRNTLSSQLDDLDRRCELTGLSVADYELRKDLQSSLNKILREEEIKWYQRSKERDLKEGNNITRYFMIKASGRKRKNKIFRFVQDGVIIQGDKELLDYATKFYKELFGPVDLLPISLSIPVPTCLDIKDKKLLTARFSLEEIKLAVFSMKRNRAAGPDGMPVEFYQVFWDLICFDLLQLFNDFFSWFIY